MGELILGAIAFVLLAFVAIKILEFLVKLAGQIAANFISTILLVGGVIFGFALFATGEASAAVAIAVPASVAVAKMRIATTGGF